MIPGLSRYRLVPALLLVCAVAHAADTDPLQSLLEDNPFLPHARAVPPPPPPQLELRGVLVEGKTTWLNVYNLETKESAWVQRGDQVANFSIKDYDAGRETLIVDYQQRPVTVALKQSRVQLSAGSARRGAVHSLASAGPPAQPQVPAAMPLSEQQRIEQVADEIRGRREARRKVGG